MAMFADIMSSYTKNDGRASAYGTGQNDVGPPQEKAQAQPDPAYVTGGTDAGGANLQSMYAASAGIQPQGFTKADPILSPEQYPSQRQGSSDGRLMNMAIMSSAKLKAGIRAHKGVNRADHGGKLGFQDKIGKLMFEVQELGKEVHALKSRRK
jgi:hypothetical protein